MRRYEDIKDSVASGTVDKTKTLGSYMIIRLCNYYSYYNRPLGSVVDRGEIHRGRSIVSKL